MYDSDDGSSYCEDDESWGSEWEEDFGEEEEPPPAPVPEVIKEPTPPPLVIRFQFQDCLVLATIAKSYTV